MNAYRIVWAGAMLVCWLGASRMRAQDPVTVASCPGQAALPVVFKADCTHVADAAAKQMCGPFVENQACKGVPRIPEDYGRSIGR